MQLAVNIFVILALLIAAVIPIRIYFKTKSYSRLILSAWGTIFAWAVLNCIVVPGILGLLGIEDLVRYFPEGPAVVASAIAGWIFGLELAVLVLVSRGVRWVFRRLFGKAEPRG